MSNSNNDKTRAVQNNKKESICFCPYWVSISSKDISELLYQDMLDQSIEEEQQSFDSYEIIWNNATGELHSQSVGDSLDFAIPTVI